MKMHAKDYAHILAAMQRKVNEVPQVIAEYARAGLSDKRLAWDLLRAAIGIERICQFYTYLNDTHINTAALRALKELRT